MARPLIGRTVRRLRQERSLTQGGGRRVKLPHLEARAVFEANANHFPALEQAAEAVRRSLEGDGLPAGMAASRN